MTRRRLTAVIAIVAAFAIALAAGQATGVLAAWGDAVWGTSSFGRAEPVQGYARALGANTQLARAVTDYAGAAAKAEHSHTATGSTATGWKSASSPGIAGIGSYTAEGSAEAKFRYEEPTATAVASVRKLELQQSALPFSTLRAEIGGTFTASASCPLYGGEPTVTEPAGGTVKVDGHTIAIPAANSSTTFDYSAGLTTGLRGSLTKTVTKTATSALSSLRLTVIEYYKLGGGTQWSMNAELVRAECGIGGSAPPLASPMMTMAMANNQEDVEGTEEAAATETEPADSEQTEPEVSEAESPTTDTAQEESAPAAAEVAPVQSGPTTPIAVQPNSPFEVIATNGRELGTATIHEVQSTSAAAGEPATVAVRMTVATSEEAGAGRLSALSADDFRQVTSVGLARVGTAPTEDAPALPKTLQPEHTYTGWITFVVDDAARSAMWLPAGTAGWTFRLPISTVESTPEAAPTATPDETEAVEPARPVETSETASPAASTTAPAVTTAPSTRETPDDPS